jgi:hypothetical protein
MTIADIIRRADGRAGSHGAWRVHRWTPANGGACATLYHYRTAMLSWRIDQPDDPSVLAYGTGHGSVSDQGGMNTAFRALGLPYRFDRDQRGGGPRITELRQHACGHVTDPAIVACTCNVNLSIITGIGPEADVDTDVTEAA